MRSCAVAVMALLMMLVITALGTLFGLVLGNWPVTDAPACRPEIPMPIATWPYLPAEPSATAIDTAVATETPTVAPIKSVSVIPVIALAAGGPQFLPVVLAAPAAALVAEVEPAPSSTPVMPTAAPTDTPVPTATAAPTALPTATPFPTETGTATPTWTPSPTETPTSTPVPVPVVPERAAPIEIAPGPVCDCNGDTRNCPTFDSQAAAQACFNHCRTTVGGDIHDLDRDDDGIACEDLP